MKFTLIESFDDEYFDGRSRDDYESILDDENMEDLLNYIDDFEDPYMTEYLENNYSREEIIDVFKDYCLSEDDRIVKDETVFITIQDKDGEYDLDWDEVINEVLDSWFITPQDRKNAKREYVENHYPEIEERRKEHNEILAQRSREY